MLVLAVCSLKGGVGKTSVTLGLASGAHARGLRTLVVDLDPQGDVTTGLAVAEEPSTTLADVLEDPRAKVVRSAVVPSGWSWRGADGAQVPLDVLTVDARFARDAVGDAGDRAVLAALATVAREMSLDAVATGVDNLTIDNVVVDTNRDGFDIDSVGFTPVPLPAAGFALLAATAWALYNVGIGMAGGLLFRERPLLGVVLGLLRRSAREMGQTVIMVTHDPVAASAADRVVLLADGRLAGELVDPTVESVTAALTALSAPAEGGVR